MVASWYWEVCPWVMDAYMGRMGVSRMTGSYGFPAVDAWAVQTGAVTVVESELKGVACYFSEKCEGVVTVGPAVSTTSTTMTSVASNSRGNMATTLPPSLKESKHADIGTIVTIVGSILAFLAGLAILGFLYRRRRRRRYQCDRQSSRQRRGLPMTQITAPAQPEDGAWGVLTNAILDSNLVQQRELEHLSQEIRQLAAATRRGDGGTNQSGTGEEHAPQATPQVAAYGNRDESGLQAFENHLTCVICYRILRNPVTVICDSVRDNSGCRKYSS